MPFAVSVIREDRYLRLNVGGLASPQNHSELIDEALRQIKAAGVPRLLLDMRGVQGQLPLADQLFIAEQMARKLALVKRVAMLVAADPHARRGEATPSRPAVSLATFDDEAMAVQWLREGAEPN